MNASASDPDTNLSLVYLMKRLGMRVTQKHSLWFVGPLNSPPLKHRCDNLLLTGTNFDVNNPKQFHLSNFKALIEPFAECLPTTLNWRFLKYPTISSKGRHAMWTTKGNKFSIHSLGYMTTKRTAH